MRRILLIIVCFFFFSSSSFADIVPVPMEPNGLEPVGDTKVQMQSEHIKIELNPSYARIHCIFNMKNTGDEEKIEVGFPEINLGYHLDIRDSKSSKLKDFKVMIDGKKVDYSPKFKVDGEDIKIKIDKGEKDKDKKAENESKDNKNEKKEDNSDKEEKRYIYGWYHWSMTFKEKEAKVIEVFYNQPYGLVMYQGVLKKRFFRYPLLTGAGWFDKINKIKIEVKFKDMTKDNIISASPKDYKMTKTGIVWEMEDMEPTYKDDIDIRYNVFKDFDEALERCKKGVDHWQEAWGVLYNALKKDKIDDLDKIIEHGFKHAEVDKSYYLEEIATRRIALNQLVARIKYKQYKLNETEEKKKELLAIFDKIKEDTKIVLKSDDHALDRLKDINSKVDFIFEFTGFDKGVYKWILTEDVTSEDWMLSWEGPRSFEGGWISEIIRLVEYKEHLKKIGEVEKF